MRIISYLKDGEASYGAVIGNQVIDLKSRLSSGLSNIIDFIASEDAQAQARSIIANSTGDVSYDDVTLLPVVPDAGKVFCIGVNYKDHEEEAARATNRPVRKPGAWPMTFMRYKDSLTAHRQPIYKAKVSDQLDYEAELLVVIGKKTGRYLDESQALGHVFGYSCMNDASFRDYQFHNSQIGPGKNFENTGATGPWIVTADEIPDPQNLNVQMRLNGEIMQSSNTELMIHSVSKIISYITHWVSLNPGDLIATGTMGGVGLGREPQVWMKAGDVAEIDIEGIGILRNVVEDEPV